MLAKNFLTRAGAVAALAATLAATTAPNVAYARHGSGGDIALGILGGVLVGSAIAATANPYYGGYSYPYYAAPAPSYYYAPPRVYYTPQPSYYYQPSYYSPQPAYYQQAPYGYVDYGYDR
jgi:hypothetical protein